MPEEQGQKGGSSAPAGSVGDITHYLSGIDFPKSKQEVIDYAKNQGAAEEDIQKLQNIPDREYGSMADLMQGVGEAS